MRAPTSLKQQRVRNLQDRKQHPPTLTEKTEKPFLLRLRQRSRLLQSHRPTLPKLRAHRRPKRHQSLQKYRRLRITLSPHPQTILSPRLRIIRSLRRPTTLRLFPHRYRHRCRHPFPLPPLIRACRSPCPTSRSQILNASSIGSSTSIESRMEHANSSWYSIPVSSHM